MFSRYDLPWTSTGLKRTCRRNQRLYNKSKKSVVMQLKTRAAFLAVSMVSLITIMALLTYTGRIHLHEHGFASQIHSARETLDIQNVPMVYRTGLPFEVTQATLERLSLPPKQFTDLEDGDFLQKIAFVTAASSNHFTEITDLVASVQKYFPKRSIHVYDIGLDASHKLLLTGSAGKKKWCNVEYHFFNFSAYPEHVSTIMAKAWKPLIWQDMLRTYPGIMWLDASVRLLSGDLKPFRSKLRQNGGVLMFSKATHSNFAVTAPDMYTYLPTDQERQKNVRQWEDTLVLLYNTERLYWHVLHWSYLCALTERCIASFINRPCKFEGGRWLVWDGCVRHDQPMINILLTNWYNYNTTYYTANAMGNLLSIKRNPTHWYNVKLCNKK